MTTRQVSRVVEALRAGEAGSAHVGIYDSNVRARLARRVAVLDGVEQPHLSRPPARWTPTPVSTELLCPTE